MGNVVRSSELWNFDISVFSVLWKALYVCVHIFLFIIPHGIPHGDSHLLYPCKFCIKRIQIYITLSPWQWEKGLYLHELGENGTEEDDTSYDRSISTVPAPDTKVRRCLLQCIRWDDPRFIRVSNLWGMNPSFWGI